MKLYYFSRPPTSGMQNLSEISLVSKLPAVCIGEFVGVFLLVFLGTSAVTVATIFNAFNDLFQVACIWGIAVILAIYITRHLSCAHLNPAVSLGMTLAGRMEPRLLPWYMGAQLLGGIAAGVVVLLIFHGPIAQYEVANSIIRGTPKSVRTAMFFGEYFPNPGMAPIWLKTSIATGMLAEGIGTFLLVIIIFSLTEGCNVGRPNEGSSPIFIGAALTAIISIIGPLTQAGLNPARDLGPRIVAYLAGWGSIAIPGPKGGFFVVYVVAPLMGGVLASIVWRFALAPLMRQKVSQSSCSCDSERIVLPQNSSPTLNK